MPEVRNVLLEKAKDLWGYSVKAMRRKIESGVWLEKQQWCRAPDGRIHIIPEGVDKWIEGPAGQSDPDRVKGETDATRNKATPR